MQRLIQNVFELVYTSYFIHTQGFNWNEHIIILKHHCIQESFFFFLSFFLLLGVVFWNVRRKIQDWELSFKIRMIILDKP